MKIDTIQRFCNDIDAIRRFYTELLGLEPTFSANDAERGYISYDFAGVQLLFLRATAQQPVPTGFAKHPGYAGGTAEQTLLVVDVGKRDMQQLYAKARAMQIEILGDGIIQNAQGQRQLVLRDPMGVTVELFSTERAMATREPSVMTTPHTFQLGTARVVVINVGELQFDLAESLNVLPEERPDRYAALFAEPLHVPVQCVYIELPNQSLLVDAGSYELPPDSAFRIPGYQPPPGLLEQLASIGVQPDDIDHVIITHMHFDHYNGLLTTRDGDLELSFPHARHHMPRADWERPQLQEALRNPTSLENRLLTTLTQRGLLDRSTGDVTLSNEVQIVPAPGETLGHQVVRVQSQGHNLYCVGDLYHHPVEVEQPEWMVHWAHAKTNLASKQKIVQAALAENALLIATHIPGVGRLRRTDTGVVWMAAH